MDERIMLWSVRNPNVLWHHSYRPSEAIFTRASSLILSTVDKDCPNFIFNEIDKNWD